jgi:glycosyltransferase involved in cell wall biosynthesis
MKQVIWLYVLAYNEKPMIERFLKHWSNLVDKIIVYDNCSDDGTPELLKQCPIVEVREYNTGGYLDSDKRREIRNNCWKEARGKADWVIVVSFDEFIDAKDLRMELFNNTNYDTIKPQHIEMVNFDEGVYTSKCNKVFPQKPQINPGFMSKTLIFNPNQIQEINYTPGAHTCHPIKVDGSKVKELLSDKIICKHYHYLGFDWTKKRHDSANIRRTPEDIKRGYSFDYAMGDDYIREIIKVLESQKVKLEEYEKEFAGIKDSVQKYLEIGIWQRGSSLKWAKKYFKNAAIYGIDILPVKVDGCVTFRADQNDSAALDKIGRENGPFDIIIDDGSHFERETRNSFNCLFKYLKMGGIYIIEDWAAFSIGPEYKGMDTLVLQLLCNVGCGRIILKEHNAYAIFTKIKKGY